MDFGQSSEIFYRKIYEKLIIEVSKQFHYFEPLFRSRFLNKLHMFAI